MNISRLYPDIKFSNTKEINQQIIQCKTSSKPIISEIIQTNRNNESKKLYFEYTESIREVLNKELNQFVHYMELSIPNQYLYKPIYSRVKTIKSMKRKQIKRTKISGKIVHWFDIIDQCGISIIINPIYKTSSIVGILKQLENNGFFKILEIEKKTDLYGYRAYHVDIEFGSTKIEIQIRSVYEDIFNILSHDNYKENDKNLKELLSFQSFLLYKAEMNQPIEIIQK
ncbi:hypothetical protein ACTA71_003374 [Dictyostelium dimigraforme]